MKWYQMSAEEIRGAPDAQEDMHLAYFNTFCRQQYSKEVMADLKCEIYDRFSRENMTAEQAIAQLTLIDFYNRIRRKCGIEDDMAVIEAECRIAAGFELPQVKKEPDSIFEEV